MSKKLVALSPSCHLAAASLLMLAVGACSTAPTVPLSDPVPPPRRPLDAKTQLEYGGPPSTQPRY